ncbi:hypothetical protein CES87_31410, partial [Pseudomonas sp. ERMR1:02]
MDDVGITDVNHAHVGGGQVHHVIFVVVGAGMAEGKQRRCLANASCPKRAPERHWVPMSLGTPSTATSASSASQSVHT